MLELLLLMVSLFLVAVCGLFVMAEFSLLTVNKTTVKRLSKKDDHSAKRIYEALTTLSTQLSSAQVGITITNLAIGFLAEPAIAHFVKGPLVAIGVSQNFVSEISIIIGISLATIVTMVFGELVPKNYALAKPLASSKLIIGPLLFFTNVMRLPIKLLNNSANFLLRLLNVEPQEELASARSADELLSLVKRSAKKGTLARETATILERSFNFGEQTALDIMTPRVQVHAVDNNATIADALELARTTGHSRFPVYDQTIDNIVGVMHIKHAYGIRSEDRQNVKVGQAMRPPILVPSTIELEPLLEALRHGGLQIAIVIDEFGGTDGIVTIEDVLEELVGDVRDEHDQTQPDIQKKSDDTWLVSGLMRPDEIADQINIVLPDEDDVETLGGLIIHHLERIPDVKDIVQVPAVDSEGNSLLVDLLVKKMDANRVDRVLLSVREIEAKS
ncbi:MAG: hemolysin family protein [Candidatus Saccharimonadales bacterium]